jgi:outer membrane cobalamin receptor
LSLHRPGAVTVDALAFARLEGWRFEDPEAFADAPRTFTQDDTVIGARTALTWGGLQIAAEGRREAADTTPELGAGRAEARLGAAGVAAYTLRPWERLSVQGALRVDGRQGRDAVWIPKVGLTVEPLDRLWLRANGGRTFRDPSFDELYFEGPGVRGDPDLGPEDGWAADVGAQWRPARWFDAEVAAFTQRYERLILFVPVNAFQTRARGDFGATVQGVEARLGLRWGRMDAALRQDLTRHQFADAPHDPLPLRPTQRGQLALSYRTGAARVFSRLDWRSAVTADRFGERTLPAYSVLDVGVEGPLGAGFALSGTVHNALDASAVDAVQQPLPGRGVYLRLRYDSTP